MTICVLTQDPLQAVTCKKEGPIHWVDVAVSTNGRAVALVDREGYLWGGSADFKVSGYGIAKFRGTYIFAVFMDTMASNSRACVPIPGRTVKFIQRKRCSQLSAKIKMLYCSPWLIIWCNSPLPLLFFLKVLHNLDMYGLWVYPGRTFIISQ